MLLPDPGTIIMPCIIKTERTSPANCKHPCLHQKAIAKCTLEGSGQSNWVGCLSLELLSKYCPWVRNWRDKEGGEQGRRTRQRPVDFSCLGTMSRSSVTLGAGADWSLRAHFAQVLLLGSFRPVTPLRGGLHMRWIPELTWKGSER